MFLSFLFNMLEFSFEVRANTENMILTSEVGDWVQYCKYSGALMGDLLYFKYDIPPAPSNEALDDDVYLQGAIVEDFSELLEGTFKPRDHYSNKLES
jgi:hypothetical protein